MLGPDDPVQRPRRHQHARILANLLAPPATATLHRLMDKSDSEDSEGSEGSEGRDDSLTGEARVAARVAVAVVVASSSGEGGGGSGGWRRASEATAKGFLLLTHSDHTQWGSSPSADGDFSVRHAWRHALRWFRFWL